ncbi:GNAT family N-acetyltransferase [Patescibacteria group bacterium]|nr:GNAT family N-acetyltransferase [Patescibacteria group bacterium]
MDFVVRQLEEKDFVTGSGFVETMANMSDISILDIDKLKDIWLAAKKQNIYFFVAEMEGQIVSTVKLLIEPKFFHGGKAAAHIEDVVTRSGYEGRGLSKALLLEAIRTAEKENCYKVILDCKKELVPFYEKSGFKEHDICMRLDFKK